MHGAEDEIAYLRGSEQLRDILTGCESVRMEVNKCRTIDVSIL